VTSIPLMNSDVHKADPFSLQMVLNGESVKPSIGARSRRPGMITSLIEKLLEMDSIPVIYEDNYTVLLTKI